jgi:hypothetical protein
VREFGHYRGVLSNLVVTGGQVNITNGRQQVNNPGWAGTRSVPLTQKEILKRSVDGVRPTVLIPSGMGSASTPSATMLLAEGVRPKIVQERLGRCDIATTLIATRRRPPHAAHGD